MGRCLENEGPTGLRMDPPLAFLSMTGSLGQSTWRWSDFGTEAVATFKTICKPAIMIIVYYSCMIWQSLCFFYWPYLLSISIFNMFQPTQVFSCTRSFQSSGDPLENSKWGRWFNISDVHISMIPPMLNIWYIYILILMIFHDTSICLNLWNYMKYLDMWTMNMTFHDISDVHISIYVKHIFLGMIISISKHSHL